MCMSPEYLLDVHCVKAMSSELLPYSFSTTWHHPKSDETMPNALSGKANTAIAVAISNVVRNLFIILFEIKKACNHPFACLSSGYRQVTCILTSTGQSTPLGREPPVCLFSVCESLAVFDEREQEPKAQYLCFVQVLENGNARWFVDFVCCVRLKPVGGLRCASACSRAFRVGVCLLPPFFWVVCAANIQLFLYCCNGFGAKAFMRGRFL